MPDPNDLEPRVTALERDVASAREDASQARAESREALVLARVRLDGRFDNVEQELREMRGSMQLTTLLTRVPDERGQVRRR